MRWWNVGLIGASYYIEREQRDVPCHFFGKFLTYVGSMFFASLVYSERRPRTEPGYLRLRPTYHREFVDLYGKL